MSSLLKTDFQEKKWFDRFIDHPYLTLAFMGLFFLFSYQGFRSLDVRQFPMVPSGVIRITTAYPGADSETIAYTVTEPLERAVAQSESFDYIVSTSQDNVSVIDAYLKTGQDIGALFPSVLAAVQSTNSSLPAGIDNPVLTKRKSTSIALMYVSYTTTQPDQTSALLYNYLDRVIRPQLLSINNIGAVQILGADTLAARLWLDSDKMNQYGLNLSDLYRVLSVENVAMSGGVFENVHYRETVSIRSETRSLEEVQNLVISHSNGQQVLLKDLGEIRLGGKTEDNEVYFNGKKGVFLSIDTQPNANALTVLKDVKKMLSIIETQLPEHITQKIVYDASSFINESINEVVKTFIEACFIVVAVVYLCLGSWRVMIVPIVAIVCSLSGVFAIMALLGVTINLLTLLAMILSIGLVVDDAILVVEHAITCLKHSNNPFFAVKKAVRDLQSPIITMTLILGIAYLPLVFLKGISGYLFREFAITLSSSVFLSGVVALVLSPLMTAYALTSDLQITEPFWMVWMRERYSNALRYLLENKTYLKYFIFSLYPIGVILFLFLSTELAPKEDQGFAMMSFQAPETASLSTLKSYAQPLVEMSKNNPDISDYFFIYGSSGAVNSGFGGVLGAPLSERKHSMESVRSSLTKEVSKQSGLNVFVFTPSSLPGPDGLDYQCVLYGPQSIDTLYDYAQDIAAKLKATGYFPFLRVDTAFNRVTHVLQADRAFLKQNAIPFSDLGLNLSLYLSDMRASKMIYQGQEIDLRMRLLNRDFYSTWNGVNYSSAPYTFSLDEVFEGYLKPDVPRRTHFNQMNSVTIMGAIFPFASFRDLVDITYDFVQQQGDPQLNFDFNGPIRSYAQEGGQLSSLAIEAIIAIFFFLTGLFQSLFDTFLILTTIPLALVGAFSAMHVSSLLGLLLHKNEIAITYNIYTQLSLLTLFGLITKHGILIVDEIHKQSIIQTTRLDTVLHAASERFRPIVMTTLSMVVGVVPLIFAHGSGSVCRYHMGIVLFFGLGLGTLFTLFIFPYLYYTLYPYFHKKISNP